SEEHTSELQSQSNIVCRLPLEKKKNQHEYKRNYWRLVVSPPALPVLSVPIPLLEPFIVPVSVPILLPLPFPVLLFIFVIVSVPIVVFFFNPPASPEIYTLSLHDALPI